MEKVFKGKIIPLILAICFAAGTFVCKDYGAYTDQYLESYICGLNIATYTDMISGRDLGGIIESNEKDHGTALYYPVQCYIISRGVKRLQWSPHCGTIGPLSCFFSAVFPCME